MSPSCLTPKKMMPPSPFRSLFSPLSLVTFSMMFRGIITAIIRFVSFYTIPLESDPTWYAPILFTYTIIEPSAYFICCCFPFLRPLGGLVYTWLRATVGSQSKGSFSTSQSSRNDILLRDIEGSYSTSISAPKVMLKPDVGDDRSHFILLEESVDVDYSSPDVGRSANWTRGK